MGANSKIEWTHHTFNPWHGCVKISDGCKHCYAETLSHRWGNDFWGVDKDRKSMSASYWQQPFKWNDDAKKDGERRRVFCASMADAFEDRRDLDHWRRKLWDMIEVTTHLDWLLLTKRPQNIGRLIDQRWLENPRSNVWLGTTCEDINQAYRRVYDLLRVPARVRFLSCEPLLGPIDFKWDKSMRIGIDWVIAGGESGHGARPMNPVWARSLRDQCIEADVAFHFKQWGDWLPEGQPVEFGGKVTQITPEGAIYDFPTDNGGIQARMRRVGKKVAGRLLDGREWNEYPQLEATQCPA